MSKILRRIIEQVRAGHKLCLSGVSGTKCTQIGDPSNFVGRVCKSCINHKRQHDAADKKAKQVKKEVVSVGAIDPEERDTPLNVE